MTKQNDRYSRVGVAGDWHCNTQFALKALNVFAQDNITEVLHLGDFGVWRGEDGKEYLTRLNDFCATSNLTLYVTLGNHEDYTIVENMVPSPVDGFVFLPKYDRILFATRGARWVWNGVSFLSLGGANSIDRYDRVEWVSWWAAEQISTGDMYRAVEGGHADVMLTHECPAGVPIVKDGSGGWSAAGLAYANYSRVAMRQVVDTVKPELLFHGHYHDYANLNTVLNDGSSDYTLHSIGLGRDGNYNTNIGVYDTIARSFQLKTIPMFEPDFWNGYNDKSRWSM